MKTRDILSIIGACCSAVGFVLAESVHDSSIWWIGKILAAVGPVLIGARGMMKEPELPSSQEKAS